MRSRPAPAIVVLALGVLALVARSARADDEPRGLESVLHHHRVLVQTTEGRFVRGRPVAADGDSLVLARGRGDAARRVAFGRADLARVWVPRRDVATAALGSAVKGALGGAALEVALGPQCADCGLDGGRIARSAAISGGAGAAYSVVHALVWKNRWDLVYVQGADRWNARKQPWPDWSFTLGGGPGRARGPGDTVDRGFVRLAFWTPGKGVLWFGSEVGSLNEQQFTAVGPLDSLSGASGSYRTKFRDRWAYSTAQLRLRPMSGSVRPVVDLGAGSYYERSSFTELDRDTLGTAIGSRSGATTRSWFGANAGLGVSLGEGALFPQLEARIHYAGSRHRTWGSVEAGVTFR